VTRARLRECAACAGRGPDTKFLSRRRRSPDQCVDCAREAAREADRNLPAQRTPPPITRASARARFRARQASNQLDLIDYLAQLPAAPP
jgi:hypothetical protein